MNLQRRHLPGHLCFKNVTAASRSSRLPGPDMQNVNNETLRLLKSRKKWNFFKIFLNFIEETCLLI